MNNDNFYKIEKPTLQQFIDAIDSQQYFTMEQLATKRKQLEIYYRHDFDYWLNDFSARPIIVFVHGYYPLVCPEGKKSEAIKKFYGDKWGNMSKEEQSCKIESYSHIYL